MVEEPFPVTVATATAVNEDDEQLPTPASDPEGELEEDKSMNTIRNGRTIADPDDESSDLRLLEKTSENSRTRKVVILASQSPQVDDGIKEVVDTLCGLGPCQPTWLQRFASKKSYVALHGIIGMNMFAIGSYFIATISTIEKRYKIPSRTSGLISCAWDIGSFFSVLTLGYLGGRGHKTRYLAAGTVVVGLSCFLRLLVHLLFGPGQDAIELTLEYDADVMGNANTSSGTNDGGSFCRNIAVDNEDCSVGSVSASAIPSTIFFLAHLVMGIGGSTYFTLGMAYLDDNTRKNKAPILLAVSQCIRMLGPTIGFGVASYALTQYVEPTLHPSIDSNDPRWIGAWWLGLAPMGVVAIGLAAIMMLFPRQLPRTAQRKAELAQPQVKRQQSFKDFKLTCFRMLRNKVLLLNTFSGVCFMFGFIGYWTFMPKYMETQYRQSAAKASLISGSVGLVFSALGIMSSALVISKFRPRPRYLAAWNVLVEIVDVVGHFSWAFLSCPAQNLHGNWDENNSWDLITECNSLCECDSTVKYSPICSLDGITTFFSPCHAGCTSTEFINGSKIYGNCSCIPGGQAFDGTCPMECSTNFTIFIITQCIMRFLGSSGKAGNTLVQFRCVDEEDKALSFAFSEFLLCGLAFIPGPIVYGLLLDSACMVWGQTCGQSGNCWLYDGQSLRFLLNFTAAGCLACGMLLDIGVWYYVKDLKIYDEDDKGGGKKKKSGPLDTLLANL